MLGVYEEIDPELRERVEDVVLEPAGRDAAERLVRRSPSRSKAQAARKKDEDLAWRAEPVEKRLAHALIHGITSSSSRTPRSAAPRSPHAAAGRSR